MSDDDVTAMKCHTDNLILNKMKKSNALLCMYGTWYTIIADCAGTVVNILPGEIRTGQVTNCEEKK